MPINLMHITDLHLSAAGDPQPIDDKVGVGDTDLAGFSPENLLAALRRFLEATPGLAPTHLLVTGDLVSRGGTREDWETARGFLIRLANVLRIPEKKVMVVPGNHDVSWAGANRNEMFGPFLEACDVFTVPRANHQVAFETEIVRCEPPSDADPTDPTIELALLASPSFGAHTAGNRGYFARVGSLLQGLPDDQREEIVAMVQAHGRLDFAAIGNIQLQRIRDLGTRPKEVFLRVALMHHHLLPDPQIEITPFEAVVDAGETLDALLSSGFSLVLSGHKHHKRLVSYAEPETGRQLDVFSGPSLFEDAGASPRGFTMIEVAPKGTNAYAILRSYRLDRREIREDGQPIRLTREDVIEPEVRRLLSDLGTKTQTDALMPVLEGFAEAQQWTADATLDMARWAFEAEWKQITSDVQALMQRMIVLRPPKAMDAWAHLVATVSRLHTEDEPQPLRLVSEGDIRFWEDAMNTPTSDPALYQRPLEGHPDKTRVLLVETQDLDSNATLPARILTVMRWMEAQGFTVKVADRWDAAPAWRDYGVLGTVAVSRFESRDKSVRVLRESFASADVAAAVEAWNDLGQYTRWPSADAFAAAFGL